MRVTLTHALAAAVFVTALGVAPAAPRLAAPRQLQPGGEIFSLGPQERVAAAGVGTASGLAMFDSWVTSDYMFDEYTTDITWYDWEQIQVFGTFRASSARSVTGTLMVKDSRGQTVVTDAVTGTPEPGTLNGVMFDIGYMIPGTYKVTVKFKQGDRSVSQSYWMTVVADNAVVTAP